MKILILFLLVCIIATSILMYNVQSSLPDGQTYVFSFRLYLDRLTSVDFPDYDVGSVLSSINGIDEVDTYYSYSDLDSAISGWAFTVPDAISRVFQRLLYHTRLNNCANSAINGDFTAKYKSFDGTIYKAAQIDGVSYTTREDVYFYVAGEDVSLLDKIVYTFKYVGDLIKSVVTFGKYLVPYNCYEVLVYER